MDSVLRLDKVSHAYGAVGVFDDLSFSLARGQIGCLLGASGCGKTTVLRCIAGFEPVAAGRILINGNEVASPGRQVPPEKRQVGMVFQDYALFPHLTVAGNIGFGLRTMTAAQRAARVAACLDHPNIVRVFDLCVENANPSGKGGDYYIVMEFADGKDLSDVIWEAVKSRCAT